MDESKNLLIQDILKRAGYCKAFLYSISALLIIFIYGQPTEYGLLMFKKFEYPGHIFIFGILVLVYFLIRYGILMKRLNAKRGPAYATPAQFVERYLLRRYEETLNVAANQDILSFLKIEEEDGESSGLVESYLKGGGNKIMGPTSILDQGGFDFKMEEIKPGFYRALTTEYRINWPQQRNYHNQERGLEALYIMSDADYKVIKDEIQEIGLDRLDERIHYLTPVFFPAFALFSAIIYLIFFIESMSNL